MSKPPLLAARSISHSDSDRLVEITSEVKSSSREKALQDTWSYYVKIGHLPSWRQELAKDAFLFLISSGAVLHGIIAAKYAENDPNWEKKSYIYSTILSAAVILINATNEFLLRRDRRRTPHSLAMHNLVPSKIKLLLEDFSVSLVSALASISLTTAGWRYSADWSMSYRISWTIAIEFINTCLHLLPVELVAFNHPVYSLPLKPFSFIYNQSRLACLSTQQRDREDFMNFKARRVAQLSNRLVQHLEKAMSEIIDDHFEWRGFSRDVKKWFAYVGKSNSRGRDLSQMELVEFMKERRPLETEYKTTVRQSKFDQLLQIFIYALGAVWVVSSNLGYLVDPLSTLEAGMDSSVAISISIGAIYFLGVLLAHMGGSSFQADTAYLSRSMQCKERMPFQAKLHTKSFALAFLISLYAAPFASAAAEQLAIDHFGDTIWESPLIWAARTGVAYFTITAVNKFYSDYLTKFVGLNKRDENHLIADLQRKIEHFKRHIPSDPDALVDSLKSYNSSDLPILIGMNYEDFLHFTDFNARYQEYTQARMESTCCLKMFQLTRPRRESSLGTPLIQPYSSSHSINMG